MTVQQMARRNLMRARERFFNGEVNGKVKEQPRINTRQINKAVQETNGSLYYVGSDRNYRVVGAETYSLVILRGLDRSYMPLNDGMKFIDGRSGQEYCF